MEPLDSFLDLVDIDQTKKLDDNKTNISISFE